MTPDELKKVRATRMEFYYRNRDRILAERKATYPLRAEKARANAAAWLKANPERAKETARRYRESHREALNAAQLKRYHSDLEKHRAKNAVLRNQFRMNLRAMAAWNSKNLTDSYVRNQLSKYSEKSTREWTAEEVSAKRAKMIASRKAKAERQANRARVISPRLCECGCGRVTKQNLYDRPSAGIKAGDYNAFLIGHHPADAVAILQLSQFALTQIKT